MYHGSGARAISERELALFSENWPVWHCWRHMADATLCVEKSSSYPHRQWSPLAEHRRSPKCWQPFRVTGTRMSIMRNDDYTPCPEDSCCHGTACDNQALIGSSVPSIGSRDSERVDERALS